jgi:hypothetical protein
MTIVFDNNDYHQTVVQVYLFLQLFLLIFWISETVRFRYPKPVQNYRVKIGF